MRVALILPFYPFPPSVGGVKTIVLEVAKELSQMGHEVFIITSPIDNVTKNVVSNKFIEIRDSIRVINLLPGLIRIGDVKGLSGQRSFKYLIEVLSKINADVIHVHNIHPYVYQILKYTNKNVSVHYPRKPVIILEPHHPAISLDNWILKNVFLPLSVLWLRNKEKLISKIIVHTVKELKWWLNKGFCKNKISLIRFPAVRDELFNYKPRNIALCQEKVLTFIGRVIPIKRVEFLLYVIALIKQKIPNVKLLIIGPADEKYMKELKHTAQKLRVDSNVMYMGPIYGEKKYDYIACSRAVVLSSKKEYTPNVVIEAQALGVPVIATNVGAIDELVLHGKTGFILNQNDIHGFARAALRVLIDDKLRDFLSKNARIYSRKFSLRNNVQKLLKVYTLNE